MTDYIKRENAMRAVCGCIRDTGIDEAPFEYAEGLLRDVPAEDVEPVVRCKDCKCWTEWSNGTGSCSRFALDWIGTDADDFCSMGERKDDETDRR